MNSLPKRWKRVLHCCVKYRFRLPRTTCMPESRRIHSWWEYINIKKWHPRYSAYENAEHAHNALLCCVVLCCIIKRMTEWAADEPRATCSRARTRCTRCHPHCYASTKCWQYIHNSRNEDPCVLIHCHLPTAKQNSLQLGHVRYKFIRHALLSSSN